MTGYTDLYEMPEDDRIDMIIAATGDIPIVGFVVEDLEKATRYCDKIKAKYPTMIIHSINALVIEEHELVLVKVTRKSH